jgi:hypothetical protein
VEAGTVSPPGRPKGEQEPKRDSAKGSLGSARGAVAWTALWVAAVAAALALRLQQLGRQIPIDDEWHALHKVMRADVGAILTTLDYADFSIPVALYFRALQSTLGIDEWAMRAPMLAAGIALVAVAPWLARAWTARPVGVAWSVLLAISPLLVYMSRTARPYAITALTSTVAIVAFERWWRGRERRNAWGAAYVAAVFLGGWLHLTSLAFTLLPFLYFGALAWRDRSALLRLLRFGLVTAVPLVLALVPPVVNDWSMFTAKAGVDSVTAQTAWRATMMAFGTPHAWVAAALAACAAAGIVAWWRRDRVLAGYAAVVIAGGALAVALARPNWVQLPMVYLRYLTPCVPLLLLLCAEGLLAAFRARGSVLPAACVAVLAVALCLTGPLPSQWTYPNQFTGHHRHQLDYDDRHNPHVQLRPGTPAPSFYRELARAPAGSLTIAVAPWRIESHFNPQAWHQRVHRQNVKIGMLTPLCGKRDFGEYPEGKRGMRLRNAVHVSALLRGERSGVDFLVVQLRPWSAPPGQEVPWPDLAACLPQIEKALGPAAYRDDDIVVFALRD